jgi:hypothetical protein
MWIWNYNNELAPSTTPAHYVKGMKEIVIDYSADGSVFIPIFSGRLPVAQERGEADGAVDMIVQFNAAMARFIRITTDPDPDHNYLAFEVGVGSYPNSGLSEVRFYKATLTVSNQPVAASNVIPVVVPGDDGVRYNQESSLSDPAPQPRSITPTRTTRRPITAGRRPAWRPSSGFPPWKTAGAPKRGSAYVPAVSFKPDLPRT